MIKIFFQGAGVLVGYNFALPYKLSLDKNISSITLQSLPLSLLMGGFRYLLKSSKLRWLPQVSGKDVNRKVPKCTANLLNSFISKKAMGHDLIHLNLPEDPLCKEVIRLERPKVLTLLGMPSSNWPPEDIVSNVDVMVAASSFYVKKFEELFPTKIPIVIIPMGIDHELFNTSISPFKARKILKIPDDRKVILWNARISPEKNLECLLQAVPIVVKDTPESLFLIEGRAPKRRYYLSIRRIIQKLKSEFPKNILLRAGWIPYLKMPYHYRVADVYVNTHFGGLSLLEAMACGIPVVSADNLWSFDSLGNAGLYSCPEDPYDLAEKILSILNDEELKLKMSKAVIRRIYEQKFLWIESAKRYIKLYLSHLQN